MPSVAPVITTEGEAVPVSRCKWTSFIEYQEFGAPKGPDPPPLDSPSPPKTDTPSPAKHRKLPNSNGWPNYDAQGKSWIWELRLRPRYNGNAPAGVRFILGKFSMPMFWLLRF